MNLITDSAFDNFFAPYAQRVNGFYEVKYWEFSDEVIRELIRLHINPQAGQHIVDIGGGTGRWAAWLVEEFGVTVTIIDKSTAMLETAAANLANTSYCDSIRLVHMDIEDIQALEGEQFDAAISTYGVLSFLDDPQAAFRSISSLLHPGAQGLLMSHSYYNALASKINRDGAPLDELASLAETKIVEWNANVPPLRVFTASDLKSLTADAGMIPERVFGVTSILYPGNEDFGYPYNAVSQVSQRLQDTEFFAQALAIELAAAENDEGAERGVNLMIKVRKP